MNRIQANNIEQKDRHLIANFPSLKSLGLAPILVDKASLDDVKLILRIDRVENEFHLREDRVASNKPITPKPTFTLAKVISGFGTNELMIGATKLKTAHARLLLKAKSLSDDIESFRFEVTGTILAKVYEVDKNNDLVSVSNAEYDYGNNSVKFSKGSNFAFEVYSTSDKIPDGKVVVKVVGIDSDDKDVAGQTQTISFGED